MKKGLTARSLRLALIGGMSIIIAVAVGGFYFTQGRLRDYAVTTQGMNTEASASDSNVQTLQRIKKRLSESQDVIERTDKIVAESKSYQYQDEIVRDITSYASKSGLAVKEFSFQASDTKTPATVTPPTTTSPLTPATSGQSSLKSTLVNISIAGPVDYTSLLKFIQLIEGNLTKMQIAGISLTKNTDSKFPAGYVDPQAFTIEVYIK